MAEKVYIAIDLKSFYASVECADRGFDPLTTHLVVADETRTSKTICLAVTPSLKAYGISGRARLWEVEDAVKQINNKRFQDALRAGALPKNEDGTHRFVSESFYADALAADPALKLAFIIAPPRMKLYEEISTKIFSIYMRYVSAEDILVYSIDECFIDVTGYLTTYHMTAHELAMTMIREVLYETRITATAGIGTNLYLAKVAMDIVAKHVKADKDGVRIAELNERTYRELLWCHTPMTDFWNFGPGTVKRLAALKCFTMGDVARFSMTNGDLLYKALGVKAETVIDHAWGWEPTTIAEIKSYRPEKNSLSTGQVLQCPYTAQKAKLIVREMTDLLVLDLVDKKLVTDQMVLTVGYDIESLTNPEIRRKYHGEVTTDRYGRHVPKHAHGTANLSCQTSSTKLIMKAVEELYDRIINPDLLVRRITVVASRVVPESEAEQKEVFEQLDLFTDYQALEQEREQEKKELDKEKRIQKAILDIQKKYGKNAVLKGMNFEEGATTRERNGQIGGHKA